MPLEISTVNLGPLCLEYAHMQYDYKYCPICKNKLTTREEGGLERKRCSDRECEFVLWNNPTPVLAAVAHRNDEVILVQSIGWPAHWFSLVTGFMEAGESPEEGIAREVKEEIGLDCTVGELLGVYDFVQMNQIIIAYDVALSEGEIIIDREELVDFKTVESTKLRPWPSGTGQAVKKWLSQRGIENKELEFKKLKKS